MTTLREAAQQALEALEDFRFAAGFDRPLAQDAIDALRAALAQQDEPVSEDAHTTTLRALLECCLTWKLDARVLGNVTARQAITALRAALAQQDESETCTWHQDGDSDSGVYATSCGHYFRLEDGTPGDNKMAHCCYCGKKLVQELITEADDE